MDRVNFLMGKSVYVSECVELSYSCVVSGNCGQLNLMAINFHGTVHVTSKSKSDRLQSHMGMVQFVRYTHRIRREPFWGFKKPQKKIYNNTLQRPILALWRVLL